MPITGLSFLLFALAAVVLYYLFPNCSRSGCGNMSFWRRVSCFI